MSNMNITKTGEFNINLGSLKYLINNFSQTNTLTNWTISNCTLSNGVAILTGTNPSITSSTFTVNPNDIICVEFTVSVPTPSTTTSGPGLYLGTKYGLSVYVHSFNMNTKLWTLSTTTNTNPYFLNSYNKVETIILKNYILGSSVNLNDVPWGNTTNTSYPPKAIQLPDGTTTTNIRSGYNSNTSMIINFSNPKIYNILQYSFYDKDTILSPNFGDNWCQGNTLYEY